MCWFLKILAISSHIKQKKENIPILIILGIKRRNYEQILREFRKPLVKVFKIHFPSNCETKRNGWMPRYVWPIRINEDEVSNLNRSITANDVGLMQNFPTEKLRARLIQHRVLSSDHQRKTPMFLKLVNKRENTNISNLFVMNLASTKTRQRSNNSKKENYKSIALMNINSKFLKNTSKILQFRNTIK